jgi:hypothetical protein
MCAPSVISATACRRKFLIQCVIWAASGICTAAARRRIHAAGRAARRGPAVHGRPGTSRASSLVGIGSGIAVALFEETLARGAMHTAIERESGPWAAALSPRRCLRSCTFSPRRAFRSTNSLGAAASICCALVRAALHPSLVFDSLLAWLRDRPGVEPDARAERQYRLRDRLARGLGVVLRIMQQSTVRSASGDYAPGSARSTGLLGLLDAAVGRGDRSCAMAHAQARWGRAARGQCRSSPRPRSRQGREHIEPLQRIVELEAVLLVGERSAKSPRAGARPTRHRRGASRCPRRPRRAAAARVEQRRKRAWRSGTGTGLGASHSTSPRLRPSAWRLRSMNRKRCCPTQDKPQQAVRAAGEIDDSRHRADIADLGGPGLLALANQHHAEALVSRMQRRTMST